MVVLTQSELYRQYTSLPMHLLNATSQQNRTVNSTMHSASLINITYIDSIPLHFQNLQKKMFIGASDLATFWLFCGSMPFSERTEKDI